MSITRPTSKSHKPPNSTFFEKVIPLLLIILGIVTVGLMVFAAGVALGLVHF